MPSPPSFQKVNPADPPVLFLTLSSDDAAAVGGRPLRGDPAGAAAVDGLRRRPGQRLRRAEVRGARRPRSDPARRAADRHRSGRAGDLRARTSTGPTGILYGPDRNFVVAGQRAADGRRGLPPMCWSPTATAARCVSANWRTSTTASRTTNRRAGSTAHRTIYLAIQRQPGTNTVEVVDRVKALLPQLQAQLPAAVQLGVRSDRSRLDPRVGRRRQVHAGPDRLPRRPRHLPVPAQPVGDRHPEPGAAVLDRRHVRGDVGVRLQPRQPVADGADAVGRLRRRRRDRHAGEHRPPHGDGEDADAGGARRIEGDRLHDRLDDGVAGRRVHPGALHGRRSSAA